MPVRIEVGYREGVRDPRGERVVREAKELAGIELKSVRTISVYTVDIALTDAQLDMVASGPFTDPVVQEYAVGRPVGGDFDLLLEVGFRPGVTDNAGRSAGEAVSQLLGRALETGEGVYTSVQYRIQGDLSKALADQRPIVDVASNPETLALNLLQRSSHTFGDGCANLWR